MVELLDSPQEAAFLFPLIRREIVYRVLLSSGSVLCRVHQGNGEMVRVEQAIAWFKTNLSRSVRSHELARTMTLSLTGIHNAFKRVTGMSPMQFHQHLRLHEARRILLYEEENAETTGIRVGYTSASQFSREYRRLFGSPPREDIKRVRRADLERRTQHES